MVILSLAPCETYDDSNWLKPEVMSLPARQLAAEIDYRSAAHGEIFEWRQHVVDGVRSVAVHDLYYSRESDTRRLLWCSRHPQ